MMIESNENKTYETVARHLDGESVELNQAEESLAREVRHDETIIARRLGVRMPGQARTRTLRRMQAAASGIARNVLRALGVGAAVAAAAALLLFTLTLWDGKTTSPQPRLSLPPELLVDALGESSAWDVETQALADQLDMEAASLVAGTDPAAIDGGIDELEQDIESFWDNTHLIIEPS